MKQIESGKWELIGENGGAMSIPPSTRQLFLRMVGDFATGRLGTYPDCAQQLDHLTYLARIHSLEPVLYHMLKDQREQLKVQKPAQLRYLRQAYHSAVYFSVLQESHRMELEETFAQAGVKVVFFKGAWLRELYPVPELRTMGDMDCLIRCQDRASAHQLMLQLEYVCEIDSGTVWTYRKGGVVIEMHTHLAADKLGNGEDYRARFSDAMDHVVEQDGHLCLEREYHFEYLIFHIAKHLSSTGAGVRMVADIGAWMCRYGGGMDQQRVMEQLKQDQLWKTASVVYQLCCRWFGMELNLGEKVQEQVLRAVEAYIISGGTFGFESHDAGDIYRKQALRNQGEVTGWRYQLTLAKSYLFPSRRYLMQYFPPTEDHPWLLPVAWFCRCWVGLFHRKAHSLDVIRAMTQGDALRSKREAHMLREIGL